MKWQVIGLILVGVFLTVEVMYVGTFKMNPIEIKLNHVYEDCLKSFENAQEDAWAAQVCEGRVASLRGE